MANVAEGVTVYECWICKYLLLRLEETRTAPFFDDVQVTYHRVCKNEFDCVRRVRQNITAGPPARGGAL